MYTQRDNSLDDASTTCFTIDPERGLLREARQCPSPNQDARPDKLAPGLVVIHGISLPPGVFGGPQIEQLFLNELDWNAHPYYAEIRGLQVSAHLLIRRDGEVVQFVPFDRRAWHAGESTFRGVARCNDYAIGIELEGDDHTDYTDQQYAAIVGIVIVLMQAFPGLDIRHIAGHCDIAAGRKTDPGPAFDWLRLYDGIARQRSGAA
jgi:N-acetyl-anhydromuramoyl-L-alanine amidase